MPICWFGNGIRVMIIFLKKMDHRTDENILKIQNKEKEKGERAFY
tara:strand:+ start:371 stop:505 length:135 start_codon:yes stop_codon:yes gene_type:complete